MFLTVYCFFGLVSYLTQITVRAFCTFKIFIFVLSNKNRNVPISISEIQVRNFTKIRSLVNMVLRGHRRTVITRLIVAINLTNALAKEFQVCCEHPKG